MSFDPEGIVERSRGSKTPGKKSDAASHPGGMPEPRVSSIPSGCGESIRSSPGGFAARRPPATFSDPFRIKTQWIVTSPDRQMSQPKTCCAVRRAANGHDRGFHQETPSPLPLCFSVVLCFFEKPALRSLSAKQDFETQRSQRKRGEGRNVTASPQTRSTSQIRHSQLVAGSCPDHNSPPQVLISNWKSQISNCGSAA